MLIGHECRADHRILWVFREERSDPVNLIKKGLTRVYRF